MCYQGKSMCHWGKGETIMKDILEDYYKQEFQNKGFHLNKHNKDFCKIGTTWQLDPSIGEGFYWIYSQKNLFDIKIHEFYFHEDTILNFHMPECLSIMVYDSISGEELSPYRRIQAGCVKTMIGNQQPVKFLIHKNIPIKSIGIEIMPAYYEDYLKKQFPQEYYDPSQAFIDIDGTFDFPEMKQLLHQMQSYRGQGLSAQLFYEGKVAEAIGLIVDYHQLHHDVAKEKRLSEHDKVQIEIVTAFLNDHYAQENPLKELIKIACMSKTKLQVIFKQHHACTITEYIQQRRISQAEYLLSNTDLPIGQIALSVGYTKASRFSELFKRSTGLMPGEFRKMAQR